MTSAGIPLNPPAAEEIKEEEILKESKEIRWSSFTFSGGGGN